MYNVQDEDGRYYVREIIQEAKGGGGWVDFKMKNSFISVYIEPIDLGIEEFVIGSGLFPITKRETMLLLVKSGAGYLRSKGKKVAFGEFVKVDGQFIRGDLHLFAFHSSGICLAYGDRDDLIWRNLLNIKDDNGKPFVKTLINTVKRGPGDVTYTLNGATKIAHAEPVELEGEQFVVGSGFFR